MLYKISTEFQKFSTEESISLLLGDLERQKDYITTLNLSLNTFTPQMLEKVLSVISQMKNLTHVIFESIMDTLSFEDMLACVILISKNMPSGLRAFEMPCNALSYKFPEEFGEFLRDTDLKVINLQDCGLGADGLDKLTKVLRDSKYKKSLTKLNLAKNRINEVSEEFGEYFSSLENLEYFQFNSNTIEDISMERFLKLVTNKNLKCLNLSDNTVCGKAIEYLGRIFNDNELESLYLQDIKADDGDINNLLEIMTKKLHSDLPGEFKEKPKLIMDISCNRFDQDCVLLLEKLALTFDFRKLIIFENDYSDISNLKQLILKNKGVLVDDEDDLGNNDDLLDSEIVKALSSL